MSITIADYDARLLAKTAECDALKEEIRKLRRERDRLAAVESIDAKLSAMSPVERAALLARAQTVGSSGVASAEAVGTPGT